MPNAGFLGVQYQVAQVPLEPRAPNALPLDFTITSRASAPVR